MTLTSRERALYICKLAEHGHYSNAADEGEKLIQQAINEKLEEAAMLCSEEAEDVGDSEPELADFAKHIAALLRSLKEPQE